ncbi:hypothetical protein LUW76_21810 [Actinomadura madurae]|uniref:hypothetical protein n=1 Tax=Actinomadura madurae TaxID=1993 RepID=UPI0020261097|nr:hypothetical protein [Actinomadura madurae]URM96766.1 hypothetical protein LUW76_21810 [Actinomadura madurae]
MGDGTLVAVEMAVDELASAYARTRPADLLPRIRRHLGYVAALMDVRMTLDERRRLTVVGGWLSFLAATCDIDRGEDLVAGARPRTAVQLAEHADHPEILVGAGDPRLAAAHGGELPGGGPPGAGERRRSRPARRPRSCRRPRRKGARGRGSTWRSRCLPGISLRRRGIPRWRRWRAGGLSPRTTGG